MDTCLPRGSPQNGRASPAHSRDPLGAEAKHTASRVPEVDP